MLSLRVSVPPAVPAPTTPGQGGGVHQREGVLHYQNGGEGGQTYKNGDTLGKNLGELAKGTLNPTSRSQEGGWGPAPACGPGLHGQPLFPEPIPATERHPGPRRGSRSPSHPTPAIPRAGEAAQGSLLKASALVLPSPSLPGANNRRSCLVSGTPSPHFSKIKILKLLNSTFK